MNNYSCISCQMNKDKIEKSGGIVFSMSLGWLRYKADYEITVPIKSMIEFKEFNQKVLKDN